MFCLKFTLALAAVIATAFAQECRECSVAAFDKTNEYRRSKGLSAQKFNEKMYTRSQAHNKAMASRGRLYHTDLGSGVYAENVAYNMDKGVAAAGSMVTQWIESPGHERNMRSDNPCAATALYEANGRMYGTQMFGACDGSESGPPPAGTEPPRTDRPPQATEPAAPGTRRPRTESPATKKPEMPRTMPENGKCSSPWYRCGGGSGPCCSGAVCVSIPQAQGQSYCLPAKYAKMF